MPDINLLPENLLWLECLLRILLAIFLGFALGVERQLRLKVAGIRTHVVVATGAALFTVVSKYGFTDTDYVNAAQVAAQVVSGIGFIGAGMILHRQNAVHGLTSAAGIWLTAAIAMAAAAGMYYIAIGAAVLIILIQLFLHLPFGLFKEKHYTEVRIVFKSPTEDSPTVIKKIFAITSFTEFKAERKGDDIIYYAVLHTKKEINAEIIYNMVNEYPFVISVEKTESDR